jgi:hypothetical protein
MLRMLWGGWWEVWMDMGKYGGGHGEGTLGDGGGQGMLWGI